MAADHYGQLTGSLRSALLTVITPVEHVAALPKALYVRATTDFTNINALEFENKQLKTELLLIRAKQQQFANLKLEVKRLESLLGTTGKMTSQSVQIANVTFYSNNPLTQFLTVDKGAIEGVKQQYTVIDSKGVMGQIVQTTATSSRVLLITDPEHQIPVRIQRTAQRGILRGTGYDDTELRFIPRNSEVKLGDILESSGLGGVFPSGYPVAVITKIEDSGDNPYLEITADPIAQLYQSHKVLIVSEKEIEPETASDQTGDVDAD